MAAVGERSQLEARKREGNPRTSSLRAQRDRHEGAIAAGAALADRRRGSIRRLDVEQSTEAVYDTLCRVVRAGDITYAANVAAALRDAGSRDLDDGLVSRLLESLVDAGRVTVVPVRQRDGTGGQSAYGLPQNSL